MNTAIAEATFPCRKDGHKTADDGSRQLVRMSKGQTLKDLTVVPDRKLPPLVVCEACRLKELAARKSNRKPLGATADLELLLMIRRSQAGRAQIAGAEMEEEDRRVAAAVQIAPDILSGRIKLERRPDGEHLFCGAPAGTGCCNRKTWAKAFYGEAGICDPMAKALKSAGGLCCRDRQMAMQIMEAKRQKKLARQAVDTYVRGLADGTSPNLARRQDGSADRLLCGAPEGVKCCGPRRQPAESYIVQIHEVAGACRTLTTALSACRVRHYRSYASAATQAEKNLHEFIC